MTVRLGEKKAFIWLYQKKILRFIVYLGTTSLALFNSKVFKVLYMEKLQEKTTDMVYQNSHIFTSWTQVLEM